MTHDTGTTPALLEILVVDDNEDDVLLLQESLRDEPAVSLLHAVHDGEEAMAFLRQEGKHAAAPRPDLILLDLNLPKKDGRQVLAEIKGDENLKRIPVVILTVSSAEEDILKTYNLHANCYITKPIDLTQFMKVVRSIEDFWLTIVKLPNGER
jgi:chemotaxis family two-component system response regulator Rcp1